MTAFSWRGLPIFLMLSLEKIDAVTITYTNCVIETSTEARC